MTTGKDNLALLTDLYELTMAACYFRYKMFAPATFFSLFIREYAPHRGYFVNAGLADALELLESFGFEQEDLDYLKTTHYLSSLRFTGGVAAIPEGRLFFANEPVLEFATLDDPHKALRDPRPFPVHLDPALEQVQKEVILRIREEELGES